MAISTFELFTIGVGPSSSHTVGPMRAANMFAEELDRKGLLEKTERVTCRLYGSLGATGKGHGTDRAVIIGLMGFSPEEVLPEQLKEHYQSIAASQRLEVLGKKAISFSLDGDLQFETETLEFHSNTLIFSAFEVDGQPLLKRTYCSVGGGFVVLADAIPEDHPAIETSEIPFPFSTGNELLEICREHALPISDVVLENEKTWRSTGDVRRGLLRIWRVMRDCVERGCHNEGLLPGSLKLKRRAATLRQQLQVDSSDNPLTWVDMWAIAVSEENAAGGRVVTAPTNGAAGIIPAVLHYYQRFCVEKLSESEKDGATVSFLLTAAAIGQLFKLNASISGAEVGCQGEVGSACSMAAAGLTEVLGGTPPQVENAAEIAMEHNLGLTCDPVGGLVQVPCIERNAMAAVAAINSAQLALRGDGTHYVSLDKVIKTMRDTGRDMLSKYKETSLGGLAVNVTEC